MDQPPPLQAIATDAYLVAGTVAPSPSIANATPSYGSAPIHPPYAEMIMAAISVLKEKDGSSKKAIAKYIERAYPNLPPAHPALLTHHLKRLKNCGQLDMVKKSYILPGTTRSDPAAAASSAAADVAASSSSAAANPLKRRPGRPSKPKAASFDPVDAAVSTKRRGRPPKPKPEPPAAAAAASAFDYHQLPVYDAAASAQPLGSNTNTNSPALVNGTTASLAKKRGRPPKYRVGDPVPAVPSASSAIVKRRAGRPPKAVGGGSRPRGRPRKTDVLPPPPPATTPRGRPRKRPLLSVDVTALGIKRGRGRPPSALARLPRSTKLRIARTGRPVGRPRKNTSSGGLHASGQSEVAASVELTRKLEYMQLKVKNAVGLLKPHLINANIIDILTAIQDLEELSTMDITAPTTIEIAAAPVAEPIAPTMAHETAPPTDMSAPPLLDLSAPAYPHLGVAGQLPMNFN